MILTDEYQYVGCSNAVSAYKSSWHYYILLYAKTAADTITGSHLVSVKMRLACTANSSFYNFSTSGSIAVNEVTLISWAGDYKPSAAWVGTGQIVEDGRTYRRWTDIAEVTTTIEASYAQSDISISALWQRLPMSATPPNWLASTTQAAVDVSATLQTIDNPNVGDANKLPDLMPDEDTDADSTAGATVTRLLDIPAAINICADGRVVHDSRLANNALDDLTVTTGLNTGGTAAIVMQSSHPAREKFVYLRTVTEIYRHGKLRFRGRALYPANTVYGQRTVTCEGELCFLRDAQARPYSYQSTPAKIFKHLIREYNAQVEAWKRFSIGEITVTDPNECIKLESDTAKDYQAVVKDLIKSCGGYVTFTTLANGTRAINWLAHLGRICKQPIVFGDNLLDYSTTGAGNTDLATALIPYGAKDKETGKRLTIESVNLGKDYIVAEDVRAYRGTIYAVAYFDDITDPVCLLEKGKEKLDVIKQYIDSLTLTALDLSYSNIDIEQLSVGDFVPVFSPPHGLDDYFILSQMTEKMLSPQNSKITLGKELTTLTTKK